MHQTPRAEPLRAVDANVLLRYLLTDLPDQAERARLLVDSNQPLGLTAVALAEIAWTLAGPHYRSPRAQVATQLVRLLARQNIVAIGFDKAEAQAALLACTAPTGAPHRGDALIAACARSAGVTEIYSFDRRFARTGLVPLAPPLRAPDHGQNG